MAVQVLNDMPDAAVHRGDAGTSLSDWSPRATRVSSQGNRPAFIAITVGLHLVAVLGFLSVRYITRAEEAPTLIVASIIEAPANADELPPMTPPPVTEIQYVLPTPDQLSIEVESITPPPVAISAISQPATQVVVPPMVESDPDLKRTINIDAWFDILAFQPAQATFGLVSGGTSGRSRVRAPRSYSRGAGTITSCRSRLRSRLASCPCSAP